MALLQRIHHIELRVRDMEESAGFYRDVFGLERSDIAAARSDATCQMVAPTRSEDAFRIVLVQGLPASLELTGMDHVSLEAASCKEVNAIYERATRNEARATVPRVREGFYRTYVFDPTGYKIEVVARMNNDHEWSV